MTLTKWKVENKKAIYAINFQKCILFNSVSKKIFNSIHDDVLVFMLQVKNNYDFIFSHASVFDLLITDLD